MNRARGPVLGLIVAILIVGGWLLWSGKLGIDISRYLAAPIGVPPPDTITSSDGNVRIGVSRRYGGAIVYYDDKRVPGNEDAAGNMIDHSNGGTLLTTAIWRLPADSGEQGLCYENQLLEDGTCPGSLPFHNPTQGGFYGDGHAGNPNPTTVRVRDNKIFSSYRGVNYNYGYNPVKPMTEENRHEWQTDFWGDLEISFHPEIPDVVVVETTITYCKDMNEYCRDKNVFTQDNQLSTLFGAGQKHPDPAMRGPFTQVAYPTKEGFHYFDSGAVGAKQAGRVTLDNSENWIAIVQDDGTGIGLSVQDYTPVDTDRFGYTIGFWPAIHAGQPELTQFEHDKITRREVVTVEGQTHSGKPRHEFEPGGWYRFTTYYATGDLEKIRRDLLFVESGIREDGALPLGFFDAMSCEFGGGWARDPDSESTPVTILFYDGPREDDDRNLVDQVQADLQRADVGQHAFHWNTPAHLKDGKEHRVYAYAVSNESGDSYQLPQTDTSTEPPPAFTCGEAVESGTPEPGPETSSPEPSSPEPEPVTPTPEPTTPEPGPGTPGPLPESTPELESVRGDADGDGDVDIFDYSAVVSNFGLTGPIGDTDGDGDVDIFDYSAVVSNFGVGR